MKLSASYKHWVLLETNIAIERLSIGKDERRRVQGDASLLQAKVQELEEGLTRIEAAATRKTATSGGPRSPSDDAPQVPSPESYFARRSESADRVPDFPEPATSPQMPSRRPVGSPTLASPAELGIGPASPTQRPTSPYINSRSASGHGNGFRTIHGQHRADGSLGGYRNNTMVRK